MIEFQFLDKNLIGGWVISPELCNSIIQDFKNREALQHDAPSVRGYRYLSNTEMNHDLIQAYESELDNVIQHYLIKVPYSWEGMASFKRETPYNVQHYQPGNYYSAWHCENNGEPDFIRRNLAYMTYLNTVNDGGETHFLYQDLKVKPVAGLTLVWPAYFTHTHKGVPAPSESKYIITGWYEFFNTQQYMKDSEEMDDQTFYDFMDKILTNLK